MRGGENEGNAWLTSGDAGDVLVADSEHKSSDIDSDTKLSL